MLLKSTSHIEKALAGLGGILAVEGHSYSIVVVGGSALNLLGFVSRPTRDVDILAFGDSTASDHIVEPPNPLPEPLERGIQLIAKELDLMPNWLNTGPALQWQTGLPPGLGTRIQWREYGALNVGLIDRYDLIFFKVYAAADQLGPNNNHYTDLKALKPTRLELEQAAEWIRTTQDPSPGFAEVLGKLLSYAYADFGL